MKTYARYIFAVLFVGLVLTTFSAVANAQSLTGGSAFGDGTSNPDFSGFSGGGGSGTSDTGVADTTNSGGGYCKDAPAAPFKNVTEVLKYLTCLILQSVIPLLFAVALAVFVWGTVKFIQASDSAEKEQGRQFMLWGVIALAVMLSVWSLTAVLNNTFGLRTVIPQLPVNKEVQ